jgi:hypothetical protein
MQGLFLTMDERESPLRHSLINQGNPPKCPPLLLPGNSLPLSWLLRLSVLERIVTCGWFELLPSAVLSTAEREGIVWTAV